MKRLLTPRTWCRAAAAALSVTLLAAFALHPAAAALDAAQQEAANKLKAKGASVVPLAANDESLVINLAIAGKTAGDEDLAVIKTLPKVVQLNLGGTGVTDGGLANVEGLTTLTHLHLDRTQVTDAGLAHLKGLTNLTYLNLYNTAVTDAGLEQLKELKNLKRVYLWQTKVTDSGANALKSAVPGITINRGEEMAALLAKPPTPAAPAGGDAKPPEGKGKPVNLTCPVSGKPVDPQFTVSFEGKTVGFCCDMCPEEFKKDPKKFAAKIKADAPGATPAAAKTDDKKPDKTAAADSKPDDEGFIRAWLLLAPIAIPDGSSSGEELDKEQVANEKDLKPKAGDKAKAGGKELTWKAIAAKEYYFDINENLPEPQQNATGYAVTYLVSDDEQKDVTLQMGSNDQGKIYLNGKQVVKNETARGIDKDQDKSEPLTLKKGVNVIVFKVINDTNNWQGAVRFTDKDGKPVKKLKVALSPEPKSEATPAAAKEEGKKEEKKTDAKEDADAKKADEAKKAEEKKAADKKADAEKAAAKASAEKKDEKKSDEKKGEEKKAEEKKPEPAAEKAAAAEKAKPAADDKAAAGNLLKPANKTESWRFEQHEQGKGKAEVAEDAIVFAVTEVDGTDWHVQAFQTPLDLKDGTEYVVTFKAKAGEPRNIRVQAGIDEDDYHMVGFDEQIDLGKDWKPYEFKFTAAETRPNKNRFGFVLGGEKGAVHVKDLVLKPTEKAKSQ